MCDTFYFASLFSCTCFHELIMRNSFWSKLFLKCQVKNWVQHFLLRIINIIIIFMHLFSRINHEKLFRNRYEVNLKCHVKNRVRHILLSSSFSCTCFYELFMISICREITKFEMWILVKKSYYSIVRPANAMRKSSFSECTNEGYRPRTECTSSITFRALYWRSYFLL